MFYDRTLIYSLHDEAKDDRDHDWRKISLMK